MLSCRLVLGADSRLGSRPEDSEQQAILPQSWRPVAYGIYGVFAIAFAFWVKRTLGWF